MIRNTKHKKQKRNVVIPKSVESTTLHQVCRTTDSYQLNHDSEELIWEIVTSKDYNLKSAKIL